MTTDVKITVSGLDMVELLDFIASKNKKYQAMLFADLEEIIGRDTDEFALVRKIVLDYMNKYTRGVIRTLTGNVEDERINTTQ